MNENKLDAILAEVREERAAQDKKWGDPEYDDTHHLEVSNDG